MMDSDSIDLDSLLVTGGTGFLGLHICDHFAEQGLDVIAFDLTPFQDEEVNQSITYVEGDVRNRDRLQEVAAEKDAIVHAASAIPTWSEEKIWNATVNGTRSVLETAVSENVDRVVYISSAAVYGRRDQNPDEESELAPRSLYGKAKLRAESICEDFREKGLCVSVLRPQAIIGPQRLGIFQILFDWVESGANIPLIGSGDNKYQLVHVEDVVKAIELLLYVDKKKANSTFNIGTDTFDTMKSDFQALVDYAGTGKRVFGTPAVLTISILRLMDRFNLSPLYPSLFETAEEDTHLNVEKLKQLGWQPQYSNRDALIDTYEWYCQQSTQTETNSAVGNRASRDQLALEPFKWIAQLF